MDKGTVHPRVYGRTWSFRHPIIDDVLTAVEMIRRRGAIATLRHSRTVALVRLHRRLFDNRLRLGRPRLATGEVAVEALNVATRHAWEKAAAPPHSVIPSKTLAWSLAALPIAPERFHFMDIGSGAGHALLEAASFPFKSLVGVEFAAELHNAAEENLEWAMAAGRVQRGRIELRHASALDMELPPEPTVMFLFNSFREPVISRFLDRLAQSVRERPRPVIVVYVNPTVAQAFERSDFAPVGLRLREQRLIKFFSPFAVRAYACRPWLAELRPQRHNGSERPEGCEDKRRRAKA